jgi:hypothetical protein
MGTVLKRRPDGYGLKNEHRGFAPIGIMEQWNDGIMGY